MSSCCHWHFKEDFITITIPCYKLGAQNTGHPATASYWLSNFVAGRRVRDSYERVMSIHRQLLDGSKRE